MATKEVDKRPVQIVVNAGEETAVDGILSSVDALGPKAGADEARFRPVAKSMVGKASNMGTDGWAFLDKISLGDMIAVLARAHGMGLSDVGMAARDTNASAPSDLVELVDAAAGGLLHIAGVRQDESQRFKPVVNAMASDAAVTGDGRDLLRRLAVVKPAAK